jgi:hypothetical protein
MSIQRRGGRLPNRRNSRPPDAMAAARLLRHADDFASGYRLLNLALARVAAKADTGFASQPARVTGSDHASAGCLRLDGLRATDLAHHVETALGFVGGLPTNVIQRPLKDGVERQAGLSAQSAAATSASPCQPRGSRTPPGDLQAFEPP